MYGRGRRQADRMRMLPNVAEGSEVRIQVEECVIKCSTDPSAQYTATTTDRPGDQPVKGLLASVKASTWQQEHAHSSRSTLLGSTTTALLQLGESNWLVSS